MNYYDNFKITSLDTKVRDYQDGYYSFEDTIFYPNKGGILADEGTINGLKVLDLKMVDDILYHKVDGELNGDVHMEVDYNNRLINTSVQTAFHLLDGYYERMGLYIIAIGVNHQNMWYEVNSKDVDEDHLKEVSEYIDNAIKDEIPLDIKYIKGSEYRDPSYHHYDQLRIVSYGDLDSQACATLHLNHTGQIGAFVILDHEKTSRGTKVYCAMSKDIDGLLKDEHHLLKQLCNKLSVPKEEASERLNKLLKDNVDLKKENKALEEKLLSYEVADILNNDAYLIEYEGNLKALAQALLKAKTNKIVYKVGEVIEFSIISSDKQAKEIFEKISDKLNVKGGGSPLMYTLRCFDDKDKFLEVIKEL